LANRSLRLEPLETRQLLTAAPVITEFMAANDGGVLVDEDGDNSDWIELSNIGDAPIDLAGWHLSDDPNNLDLWTFPSQTLNPGQYIVVFASSKDRAVSGFELHTNFGLATAGDFLALVQPDGTTVATQFSPEYPEQRSNVSYGMRTSGGVVFPGDLRYFSPATPGAANDEGYLDFADKPDFSAGHGFYNTLQNVGIGSTTPGAVIRYTLDGSTPTVSNGTVYSGPLAINDITVLRAGAFATGYLPSAVETQTYLFVAAVPTHVPQGPETAANPPSVPVGTPPPPPAGYPSNWGTAPLFPELGLPPFLTPADYAIDPAIVNDSAYTADFYAGLTAIPSVSMVMSEDDLFGLAGIYSHPWERGDAWERATSIELINPDGSPGFQIDAGVRMLGNASRQPYLTPKHSLRIEMRSQYGQTELDYPLFGTGSGAVSTFDSFVLRANLSDSWLSPQGAAPVLTFVGSQGRPRAQYARDNFARELQAAMGQLVPDSNYVHVYINGIYWGMHDLIERRDGDFVASHLGGAPEDYDVLQDDVFEDSGLVVEGDTVAWDAMFALANSGLVNNGQYQQIQQYLDIDKFIDYMNLHLYLGSQDWPYNNWTAVRRREVGGTFEFFIWDAEYILHDPTLNRTGVNDAASPGQLFANLRLNADFRLRFADRAHEFLFNDGLLTPGPAWARYEALLNQIEDPLVAESARWGDYRIDVHRAVAGPYELSTRDNQWLTEKVRLRDNYFPVRTANVLNQYIAAGLYPSVVAPEFNQHGGQVTSGFQLTIAAPAGTIYRTLDGSDPLDYDEVALAGLVYSSPITLTSNTVASARVRNGGVWSALSTAGFTVEVPQVRITELMYHPLAPPLPDTTDKDEFEFVEVQNVGTTPINLQGMVLLDAVEFTFPSVVLGPGQFAVVVENQVAFESRYGNGLNVVGQYSGKLSNSGELVTFRDSFGQTIQSFTFLDDDWYPSTDGPGHSLVILDATGSLPLWGQQIGWRPSTNLQGSPGAADPLVLNRLLFYNQSGTATRYDGNNLAINSLDDLAIASDKVAYLPEAPGAATFASVSSYSKGINGIMVDIVGSHPSIIAADFIFKVGNNNSPSTWTTANAPTSVSVRAGAGVGGSDRVEIIWNTGAPFKQWLEVITLANANTGLPQKPGYPAGQGDVFFFGNAPGNTGVGDTTVNATVNAVDENGARLNGQTLANNIPITNIYDFNRNGSVTAVDESIARLNGTNPTTSLKYLNLASPPLAPQGDTDVVVASDGSGDAGLASALTAPRTATLEGGVPRWLADRAGDLDLNVGRPARLFQYLHDQNSPRSRALLQKFDAVAEALGLDDTFLDSLLEDLGLE
jgi:hypothetical protein